MSRLKKLLQGGHFVVSGEIGPPKNTDGEKVRKNAETIKKYVDAVNLTDNQTAVVRMSSIAAAVQVLAAGVEPIVQMTCRDRNRIGLQSDILGAYSLGVRNILCLSGDHQVFGNHATAKNVWDIDSIQLVYTMKNMRDEKKFLCGEEMKAAHPEDLFIGAAANPFGDPFEFRVLRLEKKINAGADFIQTQCIIDLDRFERWMAMVRERGLHHRIKILAGVMPFKSPRAAEMSKTVSGMMVPDNVIERMKKAEDPQAEGVAITVEIIERLKQIEGVAGIHIMAPMWESIIPTIVEKAGLYPRPVVE